MDYDAYDAQAGTINIDDITSDEFNRDILRKLKTNCEELTEMWVCGEDMGDRDNIDYYPTNAHDLGWLGYFIGQNTRLQHFQMGFLNGFDHDVQPLFRGMCYNRIIDELTFCCYDLRGGDVFRTLIPFFKHNRSLSEVDINECNLGDDGCRLLSLALGGCNSLEQFDLLHCGVTDDQSVNIIEALGGNAQLESIELNDNDIGRAGCVALAKVFQLETTNVQNLTLRNNSIDDEGMEALMPALAKSRSLILLNLAENNGITSKGWSFLSQIFCNASSINATYLSNHTLESVGDTYDGDLNDSDSNSLLILNGSGYPKKQIAMMKILKYHNNFDMHPLFEWDFKVLPCMIEWFERAAECPSRYGMFSLPDLEAMIRQRKLSAIYQFIRGMPLEFIETRSMHELKEFAARKKRLRSELEEMEMRKKRLRDELEEVKDLERRILKSRTSR